MDHNTKVKLGDYVQFLYRKNSNLQLTGFVVNILKNTIVVDTITNNAYIFISKKPSIKSTPIYLFFILTSFLEEYI